MKKYIFLCCTLMACGPSIEKGDTNQYNITPSEPIPESPEDIIVDNPQQPKQDIVIKYPTDSGTNTATKDASVENESIVWDWFCGYGISTDYGYLSATTPAGKVPINNESQYYCSCGYMSNIAANSKIWTYNQQRLLSNNIECNTSCCFKYEKSKDNAYTCVTQELIDIAFPSLVKVDGGYERANCEYYVKNLQVVDGKRPNIIQVETKDK